MDQVFNDAVVKFTAANKGAAESALRFNQIAVRAQGLLARQQVAAFENCWEAGSRQLSLVTQTRDPKELLARQAEIAVELGEKLVAVAQEALDVQAQAREEMTSLFEDGLKAVKAQTAKPAPKAKATASTRSSRAPKQQAAASA